MEGVSFTGGGAWSPHTVALVLDPSVFTEFTGSVERRHPEGWGCYLPLQLQSVTTVFFFFF